MLPLSLSPSSRLCKTWPIREGAPRFSTHVGQECSQEALKPHGCRGPIPCVGGSPAPPPSSNQPSRLHVLSPCVLGRFTSFPCYYATRAGGRTSWRLIRGSAAVRSTRLELESSRSSDCQLERLPEGSSPPRLQPKPLICSAVASELNQGHPKRKCRPRSD